MFMKKDNQKNSKNHPNEEGEAPQDLPNKQDQNASDEEQPMVALTFDEFEAMEKKIEALQGEVEEKQDQYLRTRADFENYKKRVLRDTTRSYQDAMTSVMKIFLSVADDLERALKNKPEGEQIETWFNGIELIHQKLMNQMKNQGVARMDVNPGDEFDPNIHEAITQEDHPDFTEGEIIDVVQPGYRISERIIRPAMVRVAR
jgi:molecular chaperone GrpE